MTVTAFFTHHRHAAAVGLIVTGFIVLAIAYSRATPLFEPPDEVAHFLYVHNILVEGGLPLLEDRSAVFASQSTQRHHLPLYYLTGALLIAGTDRSDLGLFVEENQLASIGAAAINNQNLHLHPFNPPTDGTMRAVFILRAFSIMLAASTLLLIYRGTALLFSRTVGVLAVLLAASIPTFIFIGGSISNDNLVTFLFTAGVVWCAAAWQRARLRPRDAVLIGLILGGVALSKHNGLALFGVVGVIVLAGALVRRWSWRAALTTLVIAGAIAALLAGWWYLRNLQLYGDLFAIRASTAIWGRGASISVTPLAVLDEARGIYYSFWMTLGYLNVMGPQALYPYTGLLVIGGLMGVGRRLYRSARRRDGRDVFAVLLCGLVIAAVIAAQIVTTRQIASSQGRILFPALIAFTPLIVIGWGTLLPRRFIPLLIVPVTLAALTAPVIALPQAYRPLTVLAELPSAARPIDAAAEGLRLVGYTLDRPAAAPGDLVSGALYFTGAHPDNPRLILRALDPRTGDLLGGAELYPGMVSTRTLDPALLYRTPFRFYLNPAPMPLPPLQIGLLADWRTVINEDAAQGRYLAWESGTPPILDGWTLIDPAYTAAAPAVPQTVTFGDVVTLEGYTRGGETIALHWRVLTPPVQRYRLAFGALDTAGGVVWQADGEVSGLPAPAWRPGLRFTDVRPLTLPSSATQLYLGWYDTETDTRLPSVPDPRGDGLWIIPLAAE